MCRHAHVHGHVHARLSEGDRQAVRKLAGLMLPIYVAVALAVVVTVAVEFVPRGGTLLATAVQSTASR